MNHTLDDIAMRMQRLERKLRWCQMGAFVVLLLALLGLFLAGRWIRHWVPEEVKAHEFVLVDYNQKARARLSSAADTVQLVLLDTTGHQRAVVSASNDLAVVWLEGASGRMQAVMGVTRDDVPTVSLFDKEGVLRTMLSVRPDNNSRLELSGKDGRFRLEVAASEKGDGTVRIKDGEGKVTWRAP
jgi:hypothetical protein